MIYTCYEMIQDCRAGKPEGWSYFLTQYAPVTGKLVHHYFPERAGDGALVERVVVALHQAQSNLFASSEPAPERSFVTELRQCVLAAVEADRASALPGVSIDLEVLGPALEPLTVTQKLVVWFEALGYSAADSARMLRMSPETAEKVRSQAAELVRGSVDVWSRGLLAENGRTLGREASALSTKDCLPAKAFLDIIDGRTNWRGREEMERHVTGCWYCIDHYCRLLEAVDVSRTSQPLAEAELGKYQRLLGIQPAKRSLWKRLAG
jgi:hypothetical protein